MDDLFYDRIHQCQRNIVLTFAEHKLHGEGAGTAAVQPSLWHLWQLHGENTGRCSGKQRQHGDRRQCQSDHHPQYHRVRTVLHQFSGDQKREHDHPDRYRACMDKGYGKPLGHPVISTENHAAQLDGLNEVLHRHLCRFLLQRLYTDWQHIKQNRHCTDHGNQFCSDHKRIHLCRQLYDHEKPHGQRPAVRAGLLDPQGYTGNSNCEKRSVHFQLYSFLQRFIRIQFNWVCYHSRKDRQVRQCYGHALGHGLPRLHRRNFTDGDGHSVHQAEDILDNAPAHQRH